MLRVHGLHALYFRLLEDVRDSMNFSNLRRGLGVLLMCFPAFQLAMQTVISARARTLIGQSTRPLRELRSVFFHAQCGPIKVDVFGAGCRVSSVLAHGRVVMWDYARATSIRHPHEAQNGASSSLSFYRGLPCL